MPALAAEEKPDPSRSDASRPDAALEKLKQNLALKENQQAARASNCGGRSPGSGAR